MDPLSIAAIGTAIGSTVGNAYASYKNYQLGRDQYHYQKRLQKKMFKREDTAHQRAVMDLKAAGLSPTLAAGAGAQAGPVVPTKQANIDFPGNIDPIQAIGLMKMESDISLTDAQKDLIAMQKKNVNATTKKTNVEAAQKWHDLKLNRKSNTASNAGPWGKLFRDQDGIIDAAAKRIIKSPAFLQHRKPRVKTEYFYKGKKIK